MLAFISYAVRKLGWSPDGRNIVATLPHFFTGMVGCSLVASMKPNIRLAWGYLGGAVVLLLLTNWFYHRDPEVFLSFRGIFLVDTMIMLFILSHANLEEERAGISFLIRGLSWIGTLSYGIYAWHAYLLTQAAWLSGHAVLLLVASVTVAYLSYRLIELPALKLKKWQSSKRYPGNHFPCLPAGNLTLQPPVGINTNAGPKCKK